MGARSLLEMTTVLSRDERIFVVRESLFEIGIETDQMSSTVHQVHDHSAFLIFVVYRAFYSSFAR